MKCSLYVTGDDSQVVLTPETEWEKQILKVLVPERWMEGSQRVNATLLRGSFFECRGGWYRHDASSDESVMVRIAGPAKVQAPDVRVAADLAPDGTAHVVGEPAVKSL